MGIFAFSIHNFLITKGNKMFYCGIKVDKDVNIAVIIDENGLLHNNSILFKSDEYDFLKLVQLFSNHQINKENVILCMSFSLIEEYINAYKIYEFFKLSGWDIRFVNPVFENKRVIMVKSYSKVDCHAHFLAKFVKYNFNQKNAFLNDNLEIEIYFKKINYVLYSSILISIALLYAYNVTQKLLTSINIRNGEILVEIFLGIVMCGFLYYFCRSFWYQYKTEKAYCVFSKDYLLILDTSYDGKCKRYLDTIYWKDISKIEKNIYYTKTMRIREINFILNKLEYTVRANGTKIDFKILCKIANFYWLNFSKKHIEKENLISI